MGEVYKELGEVKAELEKLKEVCQIKTELSESLRRAHTDQLTKYQEAMLKIEKQEKELNVKSDEVVELRQLYEQINSKLLETESSLKEVSFVNEKLRFDSGEKVQRLEVENRKMVLALEEATGRNHNLEQKLCECNVEIGSLKGRLSELQRNCSELEEKARVGKELRNREDVIMKLEEQSMSIQDQLKWKKEQFQHLEDAHKRLQDDFQLRKKEWVTEKSAMLEEITILQEKLDSQIRITESLESRLKLCNQALAHEESRRKLLEVQLSESKQCFENVLAEYEEARAKIESLSTKRSEDIAALRNSLGMKEVLLKEMEYKVTHLEQENKELLGTIKDLQEAQISKTRVDPSTSKLRNKLKHLEKEHKKCSLTLEERETEWNSKMAKLIEDMRCYESDLKREKEQIYQLKNQLDRCHSVIEVSGEETSILFMVLKSELSDVYSKLFDLEAQNEASRDASANNILVSTELVDLVDSYPLKGEGCLKQAHGEIALLTQKLESLKLLEERGKVLEDALEEHKKMLEESSQSQLSLKEQVTQMEVALKNVTMTLEKSNLALTTKISEADQAGAELQLWKSKAESFRTCLEQSQEVCMKLETSVLEQMEIEKGLRYENESFQCNLKQQEQKITDLQNKIASLNQILEQHKAMTEETKVELAEAFKKEGLLLQLLKEKDTVVETLQKELKTSEEQSVRRVQSAIDSAKVEAQSKFDCEKEVMHRIIKEKNQAAENLREEFGVLKQQLLENEELSRAIISEKDETIRRLQDSASGLEQEFVDVFFLVLYKDVENLVKLVSLKEVLEEAESKLNSEMEKNNNVIEALKIEVDDLQDKISLQKDSLLHANQLIMELEASAEARKMEIEKLKEVVEKLELKNEVATNNISRLSSERESLLIFLEGICEQSRDIYMEDVELEGMLGKMMKISDKDYTFMQDAVVSDQVWAYDKKHHRKEVNQGHDRTPLRERNH